MIRYILLLAICATALAGIIQDHEEEHEQYNDAEIAETEHHQEIEHKHATSHQSFKIHHFHAVPVYVKKEDRKYLEHPVEIGGLKHKLKVLHPETKEHHGHGLTLENHSEIDHKILPHHGYEDSGHAGSEISDFSEYQHYHEGQGHEEEES